jgi:hypothetical protein
MDWLPPPPVFTKEMLAIDEKVINLRQKKIIE